MRKGRGLVDKEPAAWSDRRTTFRHITSAEDCEARRENKRRVYDDAMRGFGRRAATRIPISERAPIAVKGAPKHLSSQSVRPLLPTLSDTGRQNSPRPPVCAVGKHTKTSGLTEAQLVAWRATLTSKPRLAAFADAALPTKRAKSESGSMGASAVVRVTPKQEVDVDMALLRAMRRGWGWGGMENTTRRICRRFPTCAVHAETRPTPLWPCIEGRWNVLETALRASKRATAAKRSLPTWRCLIETFESPRPYTTAMSTCRNDL